MESVFLQDADSLVLRPHDLLQILQHIRGKFPGIKRITSYSRSDTIDRISDKDLKALQEAGLNRIHIGMESGSDAVLSMVAKGVTPEVHVRAGWKVKNAGIELSEYYMPGLGGVDLYRENALRTAEAINRINPDFIRLRSLAVSDRSPLADLVENGSFKPAPEPLLIEEILLFLETLDGITSKIASDHSLNLFQEVSGTLPDDKEKMVKPLREFLALGPELRCLFQIGRRTGDFAGLDDMNDPVLVAGAMKTMRSLEIDEANCNEIIENLRKRLI
jgi:hypothetical protein